MTSAEALVLVTAVLLAMAVFVKDAQETITPRMGVFLLTVAMAAAGAAFLHMAAR